MPTIYEYYSELLFKKFIGTPIAKQGTSYAAESAGNSRQRILPDIQVFSQTIPSTAPVDLITDTTFTFTKGTGSREYSSAYPYIVKYTVILLDAQVPGTSYRYDNPTAGGQNLNLLSNAIPFNYDPFQLSYNYKLVGSANSTEIPKNDGTYPWVFDSDVGYVYFYSTAFPTSSYGNPKLTFWRYEGQMGIGVAAQFID